jgi:hypothetical protein
MSSLISLSYLTHGEQIVKYSLKLENFDTAQQFQLQLRHLCTAQSYRRAYGTLHQLSQQSNLICSMKQSVTNISYVCDYTVRRNKED